MAFPHAPIIEVPAVIKWYKVYIIAMVVLYVLVVAFSVLLLSLDPAELDMRAQEARVMGVMLLIFGIGLAVAFTVPLLVEPKPWLWIYGLILIAIGMTSACTMIACIPLIIFWLKDDTKRYFGRR